MITTTIYIYNEHMQLLSDLTGSLLFIRTASFLSSCSFPSITVALILAVRVKNACSTFTEFLALVSRKGTPTLCENAYNHKLERCINWDLKTYSEMKLRWPGQDLNRLLTIHRCIVLFLLYGICNVLNALKVALRSLILELRRSLCNVRPL